MIIGVDDGLIVSVRVGVGVSDGGGVNVNVLVGDSVMVAEWVGAGSPGDLNVVQARAVKIRIVTLRAAERSSDISDRCPAEGFNDVRQALNFCEDA